MKRILVVSDLHCGSIFGMMPEGFVTSEGVIKPQNTGQKYLWQCWGRMLDFVKDAGIDAVVVNGDVIDGTQRAQHGTELSLPLIFDQRGAAIELLRPLAVMAPTYFVQGTEYHDCKAGASVEAVAEDLHAVRYDGPGTGKFSKEVLDLNVEGVVVNFAHGISVSSGFYRATPTDREAMWSAIAGKEGKSPKADMVVRSHAHYFNHVEHASKHAIITPCWQLQTRFQRKNSVYRMLPDIGIVILHLDGKAKKEDKDPCRVEKLLFPLPPLKTVPLKTSGSD